MVTGRFRVSGIRGFSELPVGAFFVLERNLQFGRTYWVEEGVLVGPYNTDLYQKKGMLDREKDYNAINLARRRETFFVDAVETHWVTLLVKIEGEGPVWIGGDVEISMTTFGQLPVDSLFICVHDLKMQCPVVWRKKDEESAVAISEFAIGEYRGETHCESLERVKPVREDYLIRIPELYQ